MRKGRAGKLGFWSLGFVLLLSCSSAREVTLSGTVPEGKLASETLSPPAPAVEHQVYDLPASRVHVLLIPAQSPVTVRVAVSPQLQLVEDFAANSGAIALLNAGFFDPQNQETTSYVTQNGAIAANPEQNERLVNNPDLTPYLPQILDRSELRRYECGSRVRYDIVRHHHPVPADCRLTDAVGGGPQLLPEITLESEGFTDFANGTLIRDAIGSRQRNARTAVGITAEGDLLWVMAAQKPEALPNSGMSLTELAEFMQTLGAVQALNLDGGSSSGFYYEDESFYGRLDAEGNPVARPVKSVLLLQPMP